MSSDRQQPSWLALRKTTEKVSNKNKKYNHAMDICQCNNCDMLYKMLQSIWPVEDCLYIYQTAELVFLQVDWLNLLI